MLDYQYFKVSLVICHFCFHLKFSVFDVIFWNQKNVSDYLSKIKISHASLTPLGRVFKIHDFFCMVLSGVYCR